jgi:hypothetical protein
MAHLFKHHLCHQPESHSRLVVANGQWGGGIGGIELARKKLEGCMM